MMQKLKLYIALPIGLLSTSAHAYIGPGAGTGTIAIVFDVIASVLLALIAIVCYPLKRLINSRKKSATATDHSRSNSE